MIFLLGFSLFPLVINFLIPTFTFFILLFYYVTQTLVLWVRLGKSEADGGKLEVKYGKEVLLFHVDIKVMILFCYLFGVHC